MEIRQRVKAYLPEWALIPYRAAWARIHARRAREAVPVEARKLHAESGRSYAHVRLDPGDEAIRSRVLEAARALHGEGWNYYSDALRPEIVEGFARSIDALAGPVDYLEIGSCPGLSMSLIGLMLARRGRLGRLMSIDPYFETGYEEGASGPFNHGQRVQVTKATRDQALDLYRSVGLKVELLEMTSEQGLKKLVRDDERFELIYVDGYHEQLVPLVDFALCMLICAPNGAIILDDHQWPDVASLKALCDKPAKRVQETWKTATYQFAHR
jgi:hypothetical protein